MRQSFSALVLSASLLFAAPVWAADLPPEAPMIELDKSNKARSKYLSLHKRLDQLREQAEAEQGRKMTGTLKSAERDYEAAAKRDDSLDLSAERTELDAYVILTDQMVAREAAVKLRDKAVKGLDKQIVSIERLIAAAERSKSKPEKFEAAMEKAEGFFTDAAEADPGFDMTDRRAALDALPSQFEQAALTYLHSTQFKLIDKTFARFEREIDVTGKAIDTVTGYDRRQIEAGESLWPPRASEARADIAEAMETARSEYPQIDLSEREATLAALDSDAADLSARLEQTRLDGYFAERFENVEETLATLQGYRERSYAPSEEELTNKMADANALADLIARTGPAYEQSDLSAVEQQYAGLRAELDAVAAELGQRGASRNYFAEMGPILAPLGASENVDLTYYGRNVLDSGIEDIDIDTLRARIAAEGADAGDGRAGTAVSYFRNVERKMSDGSYIAGVKSVLKRTNDPSRDLAERIEVISSAERLALIGLKFRPDDPDHIGLVDEVQKRKAALVAEQGAQYASATTGPFHTENIDTIVFHTAPLEIGSEDASAVSDRFEAGAPIYGTAYLSQPARDLHLNPSKPRDMRLAFTIDSERCYGFPEGYVRGIDETRLNQTVVSFVLLPELDGYSYEERNDANLLFATCALQNATLGEQTVDVTLGVRDAKRTDGEPLRGQFTLVYDDQAAARLEPTIASLTEMRTDASRLPDSGMSDASLEAVMLKSGEYADWEPLRAVISSTGWSVQKNDLDLPTSRTLFGYVAVKKPDGKCYYHRTFIDAPYTGGGTYGPPIPAGPRETEREIRCENVDG